jgi:hypothetical protein
VFFDNTQCLSCNRELGFLPERFKMHAFRGGQSERDIATPFGSYRKCKNYAQEGVCNWLVESASSCELCQACNLNNVIPDLSDPERKARWHETEQAKRRLVYGLNRLGLPVISKADDPVRGLAFDIKSNTGDEHVITGHADGLITLNLAEADAAEREAIRASLNERYRTLLGHFRHEVGHYFWDRLVADAGAHDTFRALFGDERADYAEALRRHYAAAPDAGYAQSFISRYAAAHPWEDFAETFAHYLHMSDTLETAEQHGFAKGPALAAAEPSDTFETLMAEWYRLSVALNSLNRSMGLPDAYPFAISSLVKDKLRLVHKLIAQEESRTAPVPRSTKPSTLSNVDDSALTTPHAPG